MQDGHRGDGTRVAVLETGPALLERGMNRFSEQQARLGAFVGSGVNYVTAKTALTRSQWLMLLTFAVGAVVVGFVSTRPSAPRPSAIETPIAYRQTSPGSELSKYASGRPTGPWHRTRDPIAPRRPLQ